MKGGYFLVNGRFYKESEPVFTVAELSSGTIGLLEQFRAEHNEVLFAESVSGHLLRMADHLDLDLTDIIDAEGRLLRKDVSRLLNKNKYYLAAKITIHLFASEGKTVCVLRASELERGYYPLSENGLLLTFFSDERFNFNGANDFPFLFSSFQNVARKKAFEQNRSNFILLNSLDLACGTIDGSFGYLKGNQVFLPSEGNGEYRCSIRKEIIESIQNAQLEVIIAYQIGSDDLLKADEVFLFDACNGIKKVLGLGERRYYSVKTQLIAEQLSELAKKDRERIG